MLSAYISYIHHTQITGAMGCKISANGLEKAIAGCSLYKYESEEDYEAYCELLQDDIKKVKKMVKFKNEGVGVVASTLGSLEALLVDSRSDADVPEEREDTRLERFDWRHNQGGRDEVHERHARRR